MKKKNIILIIILSLFIVICLGMLIFSSFKNKNNEKNDNVTESKELKKEYYEKMHKKMYNYYKIMYKNINVPEDKKDSVIRINLGSLKREGFPVDEFVNYETKEECDLAMSYAIRKVVNKQYKIEVYYKCGTVANYDYTKSNNNKVTEEKTTNEVNNE